MLPRLFTMQPRVLITGASGFIGRFCLPCLREANFEIHAIYNKNVLSELQEVTWHPLDLFDGKAIKNLIQEIKPTHLLHLAWLATPGKFWTSPENMDWVAASLRLLRAFQLHGGKRVVISGTCAEYDWSGDGLCLENKTPLLPNTFYGVCKKALFSIAKAFSDQTKLSFAWGRIFHLFGPNEHPERLVSSIIFSLLNGRSIKCTAGSQIRDILHVEDVASALVNLLISKAEGTVNIGRGKATPLKEVMELIGQITHNSHLLHMGALPINPSDPPVLIPDVTRLKEEIGWSPKYSLTEGLTATVKWWEKVLKPAII